MRYLGALASPSSLAPTSPQSLLRIGLDPRKILAAFLASLRSVSSAHKMVAMAPARQTPLTRTGKPNANLRKRRDRRKGRKCTAISIRGSHSSGRLGEEHIGPEGHGQDITVGVFAAEFSPGADSDTAQRAKSS